MNSKTLRITGAVATIVATALVVTACSGKASTGSSSNANKTLVVDNTFDLKTADPARAFELTGSIVDKALYQTALTFNGSDASKPVPQLTTYSESADQKTLTLTLNGKHTFSSGNPVTIDDIVWSYKRVQAIAGNPSFLLSDQITGKPLTITKTSNTTMTITDTNPNPALPFILPNPSLGVLDEKTVEKHGGTDTKDDSAGSWLNGNSAGSGPYVLVPSSYNVQSKVVFAPNTKYVGTKPAYGRVVLQNVAGATQKVDIQGGNAQLVTGLNASQVKGLASGSVKVLKSTSPDVGYLWLNQNAKISGGVTNNTEFNAAVRHAIDYASLLSIGGEGSVQPGGIVPSLFNGSITPDQYDSYDVAAAKSDLAKSGYKGQTVTLSYPTDATLDGVPFATLATKVQANLQAAGITVKLAGSPISTLLDAYRAGKLQAGLMYWGPDFPDALDYYVFNPGQGLGLRAGWTAGMSPSITAAAEKAASATGDARTQAWQDWQHTSNKDGGAFVGLLQPGRYFATASSITQADSNPVWTVDLAAVK